MTLAHAQFYLIDTYENDGVASSAVPTLPGETQIRSPEPNIDVDREHPGKDYG